MLSFNALTGCCQRLRARASAAFAAWPARVRVLSGGEKVRLMLARMMLFGSNVLVIDQPTNHLDLESITAVNNGVRDFKGTVLFASHDHEFVQTIATRIIEIREQGVLDKECTYDEFLEFRETYKG